MKTLIIYDETGRVLLTSGGDDVQEPKAVYFTMGEVPEGQYVSAMDLEKGKPVLESFPKTPMEKRLEELEAQLAAMTGTEE